MMQPRVFECVSPAMAVAADVEQIKAYVLESLEAAAGSGSFASSLSGAIFLYEYWRLSADSSALKNAKSTFEQACITFSPASDGYLAAADLALLAQLWNKEGLLQIQPQLYFSDLDQFMLSGLDAALRSANMAGFSQGALAIGLYLLRRFKAGGLHCRKAIQELVRFIALHASTANAGLQDEKAHVGLDLSLRSGAAAGILFLAVVCESGIIRRKRAAKLAETLIKQVLAASQSQRPCRQNRGFQNGALGVGYALLRAGMAFGQAQWLKNGLQIARESAGEFMCSGVGQVDIASGTSGLALAYAKLHQISGYSIFDQACHRCLWTLSRAMISISVDQSFSKDIDFYTGLTGTGLVLASIESEQTIHLEELCWLL